MTVASILDDLPQKCQGRFGLVLKCGLFQSDFATRYFLSTLNLRIQAAEAKLRPVAEMLKDSIKRFPFHSAEHMLI